MNHYFAATCADARGEYHIFRNDTVYRIDRRCFVPYLLNGLSTEKMRAAETLGYQADDFESRIFDCGGNRQVLILGSHQMPRFPLYRHRASRLTVPFQAPRGEPVIRSDEG
jgi:hypothetical protein